MEFRTVSSHCEAASQREYILTHTPTLCGLGPLLLSLLISAPWKELSAQQVPQPSRIASQELLLTTDSDPRFRLPDIRDVAVDTAGYIYILENRRGTISIAGPDGRYVGTIDPAAVSPVPRFTPSEFGVIGDSLWVLDPERECIMWLSKKGQLLRAVQISVNWRDSVGTTVRMAGPLSDGLVYGIPGMLSAVVASGLVKRVPLFRLDLRGAVIDTLVWIDIMPQHSVSISLGNGGRRSISHPVRDAPLVQVSPAGDHLVVVNRRAATSPHGQRIAVLKIGLNGDSLARVELPYAPTPLTQGQIETLLRPIFAQSVSAGADSLELSEVLRLPSYLPPVDRLITGIDGAVWLRLSTLSPETSPHRSWILLSPTFAQQYRVDLPEDFSLMAASHNEVWGITRNKEGSVALYRYRVREP